MNAASKTEPTNAPAKLTAPCRATLARIVRASGSSDPLVIETVNASHTAALRKLLYVTVERGRVIATPAGIQADALLPRDRR